MPGKHAPASPRSFYLSVARAVAGAVAVLTLVVLIAMAAMSGGEEPPRVAQRTTEPTATTTPTVTQSPTATDPTPTETPTARTLRARSRISVLVLNGTNRAGLAARTRDRLLQEGYEDVEIGDAGDTARSVVHYRGSYRGEAARLRREIDSVELVRRAPGDLQGDARLTLILGADFEE